VIARYKILQVHTRGKVFADKDEMMKLTAKRTSGMTGASLAAVLNESSIVAARASKTAIDMEDIDVAIDRVTSGLQRPGLLTARRKRLIAYKEAGRAIVGTLLPMHNPVAKVSIIPRGESDDGICLFLPAGDDEPVTTRVRMEASIVGMMSARAAEDLIFGNLQSSGTTTREMKRATESARTLIARWGMADPEDGVGATVHWDKKSMATSLGVSIQDSGPYLYGEDTAILLDRAISRVIDESYAKARRYLEENMDLLEEMAVLLVERETLYGDEVRKVVGKHTIVPIKVSGYIAKTLDDIEYVAPRQSLPKKKKKAEKKSGGFNFPNFGGGGGGGGGSNNTNKK